MIQNLQITDKNLKKHSTVFHKLSALLFVMAFFGFSAFAQRVPVKNVAVIETQIDERSGAADEINRAEVGVITNEIRREAVNNLPRNRFNIMTSETVLAMGEAILEECAEENCVIALGSKIGADYIVRGIISKFRQNFTLTVEMYETEYGMLVATADIVRTADLDELLEKGRAASSAMYKHFAETSSQIRPAAAPQAAVQAAAPPPPAKIVTPTPAPAAQTNQPVSADDGSASWMTQEERERLDGRKSETEDVKKGVGGADPYFALKWMPVATPAYGFGAASFNVELGAVWGKGISLGFLYGMGFTEDRDIERFIGIIGLNFGNVYGLQPELKLVYGGFIGYSMSDVEKRVDYYDSYYGDYYYDWEYERNYYFFGPFIGLRLNNRLELTNRLLIGEGVSYQVCLGLHLEGTRRHNPSPKYDWYFAMRWLPVAPPLYSFGSISPDLEFGVVWGDGVFAGLDLGGGGIGGREWASIIGIGLNLGNVYELLPELKIVYGASGGFWFSNTETREYVEYSWGSGGDYDYHHDDNRYYLGPFLKLRFGKLELTNRLLIGESIVYQAGIGLHFEGSKRVRR